MKTERYRERDGVRETETEREMRRGGPNVEESSVLYAGLTPLYVGWSG